VLGGLSYSQHQPVFAFPYLQQDPFLDEQENMIPDACGGDNDDEEEQEEEHVI